jgi:hypothetical protein
MKTKSHVKAFMYLNVRRYLGIDIDGQIAIPLNEIVLRENRDPRLPENQKRKTDESRNSN